MTKMERIQKLLDELRYEVEVGMMQGEVDENLRFEFIVPQSKAIRNGVVRCRFWAAPVHYSNVGIFDQSPKLTVIK